MDRQLHSPPLLRLRFLFRPRGELRLRGFTGFAWRGVLGHSLRDLVCITRQPECAGCLLLSSCSYPLVFETPAGSVPNAAKGTQDVPHPFVLEAQSLPDRVEQRDCDLTLGITLLGPARAAAPFLIQAMINAAERGLGADRTPLTLMRVERELAPGSDTWTTLFDPARPRALSDLAMDAAETVLPPPPTIALIKVETPTRIKSDGHLVDPEHFRVGHFVRALFTRLQTLNRLYGDGSIWPPPNHCFPLVEKLSCTEQHLRWLDPERWSSRQRTRMRMGGLVGDFEISGDGLAELWPALWLGQWLHVGKGTSMGLGLYRIGSDRSLMRRGNLAE